MVKAPLGKRVVAYLIDVVLVMAVVMVVGLGGSVILGIVAGMMGRAGGMVALLSLPLIVLTWLLAAVYMLLRDGLNNGASYGKKFMKLKVLKAGMPATMKDSAMRNVTFLAGVIPVIGQLFVLVELLMPFIDKEGLRFGDKLAKTQVVEA